MFCLLNDRCKEEETLLTTIFKMTDQQSSEVRKEGDLYKTYHTYDCDKWGDSSFWIQNIDWVKNDSQYTKCPYCN